MKEKFWRRPVFWLLIIALIAFGVGQLFTSGTSEVVCK